MHRMPATNPSRLFLADLHLDAAGDARCQRLAELLVAWRHRVEGIYLLGDITELWIGDDDDGEVACWFTALLRDTTRHCPVYLMQGNRDFLYGKRLAESTGVQLLADPFLTADGLLLSHGDAWCTDDVAYQQFRDTVRNSTWQTEILSRPLEDRRQFGAALRAESRRTNANKPARIMDVNGETLAAAAHGATSVVHGHTHRPECSPWHDGQRLVLGAWDNGVGWFGLQTGQRLSLHLFSLARRYESETAHPGW